MTRRELVTAIEISLFTIILTLVGVELFIRATGIGDVEVWPPDHTLHDS